MCLTSQSAAGGLRPTAPNGSGAVHDLMPEQGTVASGQVTGEGSLEPIFVERTPLHAEKSLEGPLSTTRRQGSSPVVRADVCFI